MKQLKKLTLTLAALLSMTAGAWAQTPGVKPLTVPNEWNGNQTENLYINHLPKDFVATTEERAEALRCPNPDEEDVILIYGFDESDFMTVVEFKYGEYYEDYGIQYTLGDMFNTSQNGIKWYYTTEPSIDVTPVTGQTNQWTFTMPAGNVELTPIYAPEFTAAFKAGNSNTIQGGKATVTVTEKDATSGKRVTLDENGKYSPLYGEETITLTAAPGYKFKSVSVEKNGVVAYPLLSAATAEDIGKVVCAAGHLHDAKTAVPTGCTAVGILGKVTETGHGLILALKDAAAQDWDNINGWDETTYAGTTLKVLPNDDARGTNLTSYTKLGDTTVSNWAVAQKSDYVAIFTNLGSTAEESDGISYDDNVNAYITTGVGGTAMSGFYWSATKEDGSRAWNCYDNGY